MCEAVPLELVKDYLLHNGYASVCEAMQVQNRTEKTATNSMASISGVRLRESVRRCVTEGEIVEAMNIIAETWPAKIAQLETDAEKGVWLELHYQHYIELIREKKIMEALAYMRNTLSEVSHPVSDKIIIIDLEDAHGLIAYEDPMTSRAAYLLTEERRQKVADITNRLLLSYENADGKADTSKAGHNCNLERLLRHLAQVLKVRHDVVNKGSGKQFEICNHL